MRSARKPTGEPPVVTDLPALGTVSKTLRGGDPCEEALTLTNSPQMGKWGLVGKAASFAVGAAMPLLSVLLVPTGLLIPLVVGTSIVFLALLGGFSAYIGGASITKAALRVTFWGALAMALTAAVGALFGTVV